MKNIFSALVITIALSLVFGGKLAFAQPKNPVPPDLTKDKPADIKLTYNLGATGLRGWIYTKPANFFESQQGRTTTFSRQILVTHVGAKSPADGVIKINDVILGVDDKPFADDARKSIALAIQDAEKETNRGSSTFSFGDRAKPKKCNSNFGSWVPTLRLPLLTALSPS